MKISDLENRATQLQSLLQGADASVKIVFVPATDIFLNIYQRDLHSGGGVYVLRTDEQILYIGKARQFGRIWGHTGIPKKAADGTLEFSDCRFVTDPTLDRLDPGIKDQLRKGHFFIDYFVVMPTELCSVLETFLQSVYWLASKKHPPGNRQIG